MKNSIFIQVACEKRNVKFQTLAFQHIKYKNWQLGNQAPERFSFKSVQQGDNAVREDMVAMLILAIVFI